MKALTKTSLVAACVAASLPGAFAAPAPAALPVGSHYPVGAEGINGASLPPPGFYLRDYNFFYTADKVNGLPVKANIFAYVQAPRLIWMTKQEILGANYGMDIIVPFAYKDVNAAFGIDQQLNLADIQVEPVLLSWHLKQFDFSAGYAVWAPSGHFDASTPVKQLTSPGSGFWSHMLTLGAVWHPDEQKTWSFSLLGRYELCHEQQDTHLTPGNMGTLEWGVSKSVAQGVDVGVVGYYQQQITKDGGVGASTEHSRVVGVGPEISVFWQKPALFTSLRYEYEAVAIDRPKGNTIVLTLTKPF